MPTNPLLDLTRAKEFAFETAQLRELVTTFEQSLALKISAIQAGLAVGDALEVEHSLHAVMGFIHLFAVKSLVQSMNELYQTSRQQPLEVTALAFAALAPSLEQLLAEVRTCLSAL